MPSIFDGTNVANQSDSPWASFLVDEGEDEDYKSNCGEYDDTSFRLYGSWKQSSRKVLNYW